MPNMEGEIKPEYKEIRESSRKVLFSTDFLWFRNSMDNHETFPLAKDSYFSSEGAKNYFLEVARIQRVEKDVVVVPEGEWRYVLVTGGNLQGTDKDEKHKVKAGFLELVGPFVAGANYSGKFAGLEITCRGIGALDKLPRPELTTHKVTQNDFNDVLSGEISRIWLAGYTGKFGSMEDPKQGFNPMVAIGMIYSGDSWVVESKWSYYKDHTTNLVFLVPTEKNCDPKIVELFIDTDSGGDAYYLEGTNVIGDDTYTSRDPRYSINSSYTRRAYSPKSLALLISFPNSDGNYAKIEFNKAPIPGWFSGLSDLDKEDIEVVRAVELLVGTDELLKEALLGE